MQEKPEQKAFRAFCQERFMLSVEASTCECLNKDRLLSPEVCPLFTTDGANMKNVQLIYLCQLERCQEMWKERKGGMSFQTWDIFCSI